MIFVYENYIQNYCYKVFINQYLSHFSTQKQISKFRQFWKLYSILYRKNIAILNLSNIHSITNNSSIMNKQTDKNEQNALTKFKYQLNCNMKHIKSLNRSLNNSATDTNIYKHKSNYENVNLPSVHHRSIKKVNGFGCDQLEKKATMLQLRLNKLEKGNQKYFQQKYNQSFYLQSTPNIQKTVYIPQIQFIPMPIINYLSPSSLPSSPYSNLNSNSNSCYRPQQNRNSPYYQNMTQYQNLTNYGNRQLRQITNNGFNSNKIQLGRRLRVKFIAVFFISIFKTYCKEIRYKKFQRYLQIQQIISYEFSGIQSDLYELLIDFDVFGKFYQINKKIEENVTENQKYTVNVKYQNEQVNINLKACRLFLEFLTKNISQNIKKGELKILDPIIMNMISGGIPLSHFFLVQQLKILNLHKIYGYLNIGPQSAKILITNFLFVKILTYRLIAQKQILNIIYNAHRKNPDRKKITLLYGKKLALTLVLFYETLNNIFFRGLKSTKSNYTTLDETLKIFPKISMSFNDKDMNSQNKQNQTKKSISPIKKQTTSLIKDSSCPDKYKDALIQNFDGSWQNIKSIASNLYASARKYQSQQLAKFKQIIHSQSFSKSNQVDNIVKQKYQRIKQINKVYQQKQKQKFKEKNQKQSKN